MKARATGTFVIAALMVVVLFGSASASAQTQLPTRTRDKMVTNADREAAAARRASAPTTLVKGTTSGLLTTNTLSIAKPLTAAVNPGGTPDYFNCPNWCNSPLPTVNPTTGAISGGIRKFVDALPGLGAANANLLGQYIPIANADTLTYPGSDYYEISLVEYTEKMHSDLPPTKLRGYVQTNNGTNAVTQQNTVAPAPVHYLGPIILAKRDRPVRVKFTNNLATGSNGDLFIPVDTTVMGAGMGPLGMNPPVGGMNYTENRATLHLHGGHTPWISDGTPHQWTTPAGEVTSYPKGVSVQDVPDMPPSPAGTLTFFYSNQQSARLMFYHDHAYGITRLNVYAGEAAGYVITDTVEDGLIDGGTIPGAGETVYRYGIPLIIQDKTFVPDAAQINATDPTWDPVKYGAKGALWFPHVYMPNQNPADEDGINAFGRWDYGPWFWPPVTAAAGLVHGPVTDPITGVVSPGTPNVSMVMEAFMDTPLVNGTPYPVLSVAPKAYRFRILNACNDRYLNLSLYYVDPANPTEVKMVPSIPGVWPAGWPTPDGRDGGWPDPTMAGPSMIQIGTEGGFLPAPVVLPNIPIGYDLDKRSITVLNVKQHNLFLGPAERADVIVDFSQVPSGSKIILYNDSPAPVPAGDDRLDYYTGHPDQTATGGAPTTLPGYGPNTRTIMRFEVSGAAAAAFDLAGLQAALPAAFAAAQPAPIVPQAAYGPAYGTTYTNTYSRIQDTALTFTPPGAAAPVTINMQPKAIQELFELDYGRMNSTLGVELPLTNINTQTTIPFGYIDPATEILKDGETQLWKITHNGVDTHAIHFHLMDVQLVNRVDWAGVVKPPEANELGWKDTVRMNPLEDAIVALRPTAPVVPFTVPDSVRLLDPTMPKDSTMGFTNIDPLTGNPINVVNDYMNFGWEYVWHCHLLGHEEMDMMRPIVFQVRPSAPQNVVAAINAGNVVVTFDPPAATGGSPVLSYTVTSNPGGISVTGASSPLSVSGLNGNGQYTFTVAAINAVGTGPASAPSNVISLPGTAPGAPQSVTAVAGNLNAIVSFAPPVNDGGSVITQYTITSSPGNLTAITGTASPVVIGGLTLGTTYIFSVRATNALGTGPANTSNSIVAATLPGAPTNVSAVAGNGQCTVNFTAPASDGFSHITLYTMTTNYGDVATGASSPIIVPHLINGRMYSCTVTATNAIGTGPASLPSNSVVPTSTAPAAPSSLVLKNSVVNTNLPTVTITWRDNSSNEAGFQIQRALDTAFTKSPVVVNVGMNVTSFVDNTVVPLTHYYYRVRATNAIGNSAWTSTVGITTVGRLPLAPTNLTVGSATQTSLKLTWTDNATNEGGYRIQRSTTGTGSWSTIKTLLPNTTTYTNTGLSRNKTYYYRVQAYNGTGNSTWDGPVSGKTLP